MAILPVKKEFSGFWSADCSILLDQISFSIHISVAISRSKSRRVSDPLQARRHTGFTSPLGDSSTEKSGFNGWEGLRLSSSQGRA